MPKATAGWRIPPFKFQNPDTGEVEQVNDVLDMHRIFNTWKTDHFEFSLFLAHPITFIDTGIQSVINRKQYSERFPSVPPFAGDFDTQPEWWKKALIIMDKAIMDAKRWKANKHG